MNSNTKILEELLSVKSNIDDMHIITSSGYFALESLISMVQENIKEETAKSSGKTNAYKVATNLLKKFKSKFVGTSREVNCYPYETDTAQYICDAYRLFKFTEFLPLDKCPDKILEHSSCQPMNLEDIFNKHTNEKNYKEMPQKPTLAELKLHIKLKKTENKANKKDEGIIFDFGDGLPAVNAEYLLDIYKAMGDDCSIYCKDENSELSVLWVKSADGKIEALLMPVNKKKC